MGLVAGNKPQFDKDGNVLGPIPRSILIDPRYSLTPREALTQGVGKAHRGVTYAHFDFRNFTRGAGMPRGRVG
jgi:hypothetical protein